jgi:hypothetical protein
MLEIIKNVSKIMNGFSLFDGKTGVTDGKIAVVFPIDALDAVAGLPRQIEGIKDVTDRHRHNPEPVTLPIIRHVSPCVVCRGDPDAEIICAECGGGGIVPCCECGQNTTCRQCDGTGIRKEKNEPCLHCANTGLEAEAYPINVVENRYISVKYAAFLQKHFPDVVFHSTADDQPTIFFESPTSGVYGVVMCMAGISASTRAYPEVEKVEGEE